MDIDFPVLSHISLHRGMRCRAPDRVVRVQAHDPAIKVMTDFRQVTPITIEPGLSIELALRKMRQAGVRMLLVTDRDDRIDGVITACDIESEGTFKLCQTLGVTRPEVKVAMVMAPLDELKAMHMTTVANAQVGHIVSSLREYERRHTLVVEDDPASGERVIRGLFSLSNINRLMGHEVADLEHVAHSLAELQHELGT